MGFFEVRTAVFESHARGDYAIGLEAIDSYPPASPEEIADLAYWRMCLLSRLGRIDEACNEFAGRLGEGFWWGELILADPDLDNVRSLPEWRRLEQWSLERSHNAKRVPRSPIDLHPEGRERATLILLHGAGSHPRFMIEQCASGLDVGFRLLALWGSEPFGSHRFAWPAKDGETAVAEQLRTAGQIVAPIFVGFSQGAALAGYLAWTRSIECRGAVLVAPSFGVRGYGFTNEKLMPRPTYLLAGGEDRDITQIRSAAAVLETAGVPNRFDERPGLGHDWPKDFDVTLRNAVDWILGV